MGRRSGRPREAGLADEPLTTEHGAYGCAILLVKAVAGSHVLERARKKTGFDFWLGRDDARYMFQGTTRLEVSGIRKGSEGDVTRRINQKKQQTRKSDETRLPAWAVVVEFSEPQSRVAIR